MQLGLRLGSSLELSLQWNWVWQSSAVGWVRLPAASITFRTNVAVDIATAAAAETFKLAGKVASALSGAHTCSRVSVQTQQHPLCELIVWSFSQVSLNAKSSWQRMQRACPFIPNPSDPKSWIYETHENGELFSQKNGWVSKHQQVKKYSIYSGRNLLWRRCTTVA